MTDPAMTPAATLIALREPPGGGVECLMLRRHSGPSFADAWVFPGGRVDPGDRALAVRLDPAAAGEDADDLAARVAAVRETIEEAGLAVALDPAPDPAAVARLRAGLAAGSDFAALLAAEGLAIVPGRLVPFARWAPPGHAPRRFDTRFYLTDVAGDPSVSACGVESTAIGWARPEAMLAREAAGEAKIVFPTRATLARLALHAGYAATAAAAAAVPVRLLVTRLEEVDGGVRLSVPDGHGYPPFTSFEPRR